MSNLITDEHTVKNKIFTVRDLQVMLDADLAELYGVETKRINEAVKNNPDKFPSDFYFELSEEEDEILRSKISTSSWGGRRKSTKVFTEQGVYMLATVLKSKIATEITLSIIRTFAKLRKFTNDNSLFTSQFKELEKRQLSYEIKTDEKLETIFKAIEAKEIKPKQGIFYDGQIFDAYVFVSKLIKSAKKSIVLFDNYVDESVLTLLSKRVSTCQVTIYTKMISKQLELDLKKHNAQYPHAEIKKFDLSHDRFLLIDDEVYHIGASLKDLGKKWFAFSKMDRDSFEMMEQLK
jgi:hypothetical protein